MGLKLLPLVSRKSRLIIPSLTDILTFSEIFKGWKKNILRLLLKIFFNLALCYDERRERDGDDVKISAGVSADRGWADVYPTNK